MVSVGCRFWMLGVGASLPPSTKTEGLGFVLSCSSSCRCFSVSWAISRKREPGSGLTVEQSGALINQRLLTIDPYREQPESCDAVTNEADQVFGGSQNPFGISGVEVSPLAFRAMDNLQASYPQPPLSPLCKQNCLLNTTDSSRHGCATSRSATAQTAANNKRGRSRGRGGGLGVGMGLASHWQ